MTAIPVQFPDESVKLGDVEEGRALTALEVMYEGGSLHGETADFPSRDLERVLDDKLRDRAKRAVLQSDDPDWHAAYRQFEGQLLDFRTPSGKSQCGSRDNRKKTPCRR